MLLVPHHSDVRMDPGEHLPAPLTHPAGAHAVRRTLQRSGSIAGRSQTISAAGKEQGVRQRSPGGGLPDADGGGICRRQVKGVHLVSPLRCLPRHFTISRPKKEGGIPLGGFCTESCNEPPLFELSLWNFHNFLGISFCFRPFFLCHLCIVFSISNYYNYIVVMLENRLPPGGQPFYRPRAAPITEE